MNQRLLERLKRHSEFPQLRPSITAAQRGSLEPFSAGQPRLVLSKQSSQNARQQNSSQPLEAELANGFAGFPEADFSPSAQAAQVDFMSDEAFESAQVDRVALEDFAAEDSSTFSESPFPVTTQAVPTTNTEATINAPLNASLGAAANLAPSANSIANPSANSGANQPETLTARNPQRSAQPRLAELSVDARSVPPIPPIATSMPNALETRASANLDSANASNVGTSDVNAGSVNAASSVEAFAAQPAPSEPVAPRQTTEFGLDDADNSVSPSDAPSMAFSSTSSNAGSAEVTSQDIRPATDSASDFDRKAAMLELRELGVKVRVTLSNAALKAQLEAVRTTVTTPEAVAPDAQRNTGATSALEETRVGSDANASVDRGEAQLQPNPSTAGAPPAPAVTSGSREPVGASNAEPAGLEPTKLGSVKLERPELESAKLEPAELEPANPPSVLGRAQPRLTSLDASSAALATDIESLVTPGAQRPSTERNAPLEVNSSLEPIAANGAETAVYGTVATVEVYDPPNRRVVATRPKASEAPKNEAEVLFSTLPDSSPLEWLNRLNSVQALDADVSNAVNEAGPSPAQSSPALGSTAESSGRPGAAPAITAPVSAAPTDIAPTDIASIDTAPKSAARPVAPLLANLEASGNLERPRLESARPTALVAPRAAPAVGTTPLSPSDPTAPQGVAGLVPSTIASPATPVPTPTQRQTASDGDVPVSQVSRLESLAANSERAVALTSEPTFPPSDALGRSDFEGNRLEVNGLEGNGSEVTDSRANAVSISAPLSDGSLGDGAAEPDGMRQSMPRAATTVASDQRDGPVTRAPSVEPLDPSPSSQVSSSAVLSSNPKSSAAPANSPTSSAALASRVTSSVAPASDPISGVTPASDPRLIATPASNPSSSIAPASSPNLSATPPSKPTSSLDERGDDTTRPASAIPSAADALVSPSAVAAELVSAAPSSDLATEGTVVAVEVYDPPNRRVVAPRPRASEAPKNEAEVLFSTLPDSNPLEWLSRLNSVQALETDSNSPSAFTQRVALLAEAVPDPMDAAPRPATEPGLRASPDLSAARVVQTAAPMTVPTDPRLSVRAPINPGQALEPQMRGVLRGPELSSAAPAPQLLAPSAQIGGLQASAPLIATPPSAALLANPESPARGNAAPPVRLSSSAQRLIAPITGIDPNTVQIRRDAETDALTKAYRADALTVNGTVLLSARLSAETPETLGVIAHELTHVARERSPRFVPPALRQPLIPTNRRTSPSLEGMGEESIALQVEGFTRALAQQGMALNNTPLSSTPLTGTPISNGRPANGAASAKNRSLESVPWGDGVLPAPWELADRLEALTNPGLATVRNLSAQPASRQTAFQQSALQQSASQQSAAPQSANNNAFTRSEAPAFASSSSNSSVPTAASSGGNFGGIGGASAPMSIQAAEQGRSVPTPSPAGPLPKSPEAAPKPASGAAPAPDLDDLARQVYAVLKRRLITERRRSS